MLVKSIILLVVITGHVPGTQQQDAELWLFSFETSLKKSLREAFHPLMSEQPTHSSRPAADLAVVQEGLWHAFSPANVATYVG